MIIKSYMDITINIPNMFLDSGAPTAPMRTFFLGFRASTAPPERLAELLPWVGEMSAKP